MKKILVAALLFAPLAEADSIKTVTQEIERSSALTLRNDVGQDLAENLLAAQQPGVCSYCASEPDSLQLSIDAVLRAIALEQSFGVKYCNDSDCGIVWSQSNIAVDDRVGITLSDPVSTPEPMTFMLLAAGICFLFILWPRKSGYNRYR